MNKLLIATFVLLACQSLLAADESEIRFVRSTEVDISDTTIKSYGYVLISGKIDSQGVPKLAAALIQAQNEAKMKSDAGDPVVFAILNSTGGEILAGIDMGRLLRNYGARIWIDKNAECSSACVLLLAGGVTRFDMDGARVGLHRPYFPPFYFAELSFTEAQDKYNSLLERVRSYLQDMGIRDELYQRMISIPSQEIVYIRGSEAEGYGLFGEDPAFTEWARARSIKAIGEDRVLQLEEFRNCYNANVQDGENFAQQKCAVHLDDF